MDEQTARIYARYQRHLLEGRRSSFQQFDRAVLTLSGGGLALSLTFIRNIVSLSEATCKWTLICAWGMFALSIMATLISFISSQFAFDRQLKLAEQYYIDNQEEAFKELNKPARLTKVINIASAFSFVLAVILLLFFVSSNM